MNFEVVFKVGLVGKGIYYGNDICLKNYRELHEAMNCFYKALELEEFGASKLKISKALELEEFGANKIEAGKTESFAHAKIEDFRKFSSTCKNQKFSKASELNLEFDEICFYKDSRPVEMYQYREALEYHEKALKIDPNDAEAWYNRGLALKNLGRLQEALKSFDRSLEIDPNNDEAWYDKGDTLIDIYFLKGSVKASCY